MSRLYINDLKSIVNGKIVRFSLGSGNGSSLVSLKTINDERCEFRNIRYSVIDEFTNEIKEQFNTIKGSKIEEDVNFQVNPIKLFDEDNNLEIKIKTILGDTTCSIDGDKIIKSTSDTSDLHEKVAIIMPYVKKLLEVRKYTKLLENEFYQDTDIKDLDIKVLMLSGSGIFLPFKDYTELNDYDLQDLLSYYYSNLTNILKNILVNNDEILELYKPDITKEKAIGIYKG